MCKGLNSSESSYNRRGVDCSRGSIAKPAHFEFLVCSWFGFTTSPFQAVSDLSKFQSLCEEVIDLDHLRESGGKQVRVRPQFHVELQRLGEELSGTSGEMVDILREVEKTSKVRITGRNKLWNCRPISRRPRASHYVKLVARHQRPCPLKFWLRPVW